MICAEVVTDSNGQQWLRPTAQQPADLSACQAVLLTGADTGALSLFTYPTPDQAATAWAAGFSMVVTCWLVAWGVGAVVSVINRN
ncbi:MAG: hypothetical protein ACK4S6_16335 [Roseateles asaccharophilus]|uniref:hypothetical protein n=1 Tax=Roseateles asaccharophilus TaxID=582607 RepID=UPI00391A76E1